MNYLTRFCLTLILVLIPALAFGLTVTNLNDSGPGSLRQAVADTPPSGTVDFAVTGTITLATEILIGKSLNIVGPGADQLTISGGNTTRILHVLTNPSNEVSISGLRFVDGNAVAGGAILYETQAPDSVNPTLLIDKCVFEDNTSNGGGAITLSVFINPGSTELIPVTISNSTFMFNSASSLGGAIQLLPQSADLEIYNSTFESNFAFQGGAISNGTLFNNLKLYNNTFDSNEAFCSGLQCGDGNGGGAIFLTRQIEPYNTDIRFNTFNNNRASCIGPNCQTVGSSIAYIFGGFVPNFTRPTIQSNIFNTDSTIDSCETCIDDQCGLNDFISLGYNLSSDSTCAVGGPGDKPNTNPGLDPEGLRDNLGMTETIALLPDSPAIDMGGPECPPPDTDQRMVLRPQGSACDSGAFERIAARPIPTLSEWGLIAMAAVIGLVGLLALRRKKAVI